MKDKELQELEFSSNKAMRDTIDSLTRLINVITMERNYYRKKCEELFTKKGGEK